MHVFLRLLVCRCIFHCCVYLSCARSTRRDTKTRPGRDSNESIRDEKGVKDRQENVGKCHAFLGFARHVNIGSSPSPVRLPSSFDLTPPTHVVHRRLMPMTKRERRSRDRTVRLTFLLNPSSTIEVLRSPTVIYMCALVHLSQPPSLALFMSLLFRHSLLISAASHFSFVNHLCPFLYNSTEPLSFQFLYTLSQHVYTYTWLYAISSCSPYGSVPC